MKPYIIIERCCKNHHREKIENVTGFESITAHDKSNRCMYDTFETGKYYSKYIEKHGYHFTDELAEYVSRMMINANGQNHSWTAVQVKKSIENLGLVIPNNVTTGDIAYLANMYYADLYPDPLKDEASCLKAAYKIANDPDGYKGMVFCRWVIDAKKKAINIDWEKFI